MILNLHKRWRQIFECFLALRQIYLLKLVTCVVTNETVTTDNGIGEEEILTVHCGLHIGAGAINPAPPSGSRAYDW